MPTKTVETMNNCNKREVTNFVQRVGFLL